MEPIEMVSEFVENEINFHKEHKYTPWQRFCLRISGLLPPHEVVVNELKYIQRYIKEATDNK